MTRYRDLPAACAWAAIAGVNAAAAQPGAPPGRPLITTTVAVQTAKIPATILAVAPDTRVISLQAESGEQFEFTAGEEMRNFAQLRAGDRVLAHHVRSVSLESDQGAWDLPAGAPPQGAPRPPPGAKPGVSFGRQVTVPTSVVAVDAKGRLVTLLGPTGSTLVLKVAEPLQMAKIRPGDRLRAIYTEAFSLQVRPPPHEGATR